MHRSLTSLIGNPMKAMGELGHLRDFIIDDETWHIEYLVIEMHSWLTGKKVLIARKHIKEIQWVGSKVLVDVTKYTLENSPVYDESAFFHPETLDMAEAQLIGDGS